MIWYKITSSWREVRVIEGSSQLPRVKLQKMHKGNLEEIDVCFEGSSYRESTVQLI